MNSLKAVRDQDGNKFSVLAVSHYAYAVTLTAATRLGITHPTGANLAMFVLITVDCETWVKGGDTLAVPTSTVDGTAPILIPAGGSRLFPIDNGALTMSMISTAGGLACLEYFS